MLPASIIRHHSPARLRLILGMLFLALAVPTAAVIWQAYDQLKWESWFQFRNQAEGLTRNIDASISNRIRAVETHTFADFSFVTATSNENVVQRSPLSAFPVPQDIPGTIGFFQIDVNGRFSSPLVPDDTSQSDGFGLTEENLVARRLVRENLRQILQDNALVRETVMGTGARLQQSASELTPAESPPRKSLSAIEELSDAGAASEPAMRGELEASSNNLIEIAAEGASPAAQKRYAQDQFDQLNQPARSIPVDNLAPASTAPSPQDEEESRQDSLGKLQDLQLDVGRQARSASLDRDRNEALDERKNQPETTPARARRVEQTTAYAMPSGLEDDAAGKEEAITTFQSEIDPYQFSLLDSGHMVLYRNAWRDNDRYIQGLLIDQQVFARNIVENAFRASSLAGMSDLVMGYRDDVINVIRGGRYEAAATSTADLAGELLYRSRLSAPLDSIELVFAINGMPPGPGATVLGWTTIVIAIVFSGGFFAMYRLGISQIRLARQQQDFVSAVSHELKTPLTSIRMYGEMLKEGWADPEKQKQYYDYIHEESERLTRLIANVLQLARITRNEPQFDLHSVNVRTLLDQVRSKIANHIERGGFDLDMTIDEEAGLATIVIDEDCFAQVMINLVDNAIKFSRDAAEKRIELRCTANANGDILFAVRDFGPGIEKNQLKKIFQLFYRSESELTRETVGTGIGLAIVHQLVNAMKGTVDVRNCDPGAEFQVVFPAD